MSRPELYYTPKLQWCSCFCMVSVSISNIFKWQSTLSHKLLYCIIEEKQNSVLTSNPGSWPNIQHKNLTVATMQTLYLFYSEATSFPQSKLFNTITAWYTRNRCAIVNIQTNRLLNSISILSISITPSPVTIAWFQY